MIIRFKEMSLFQKLQVFSGLIPLYSFLFVAITSYIVNWKAKKGWLPYCIIAPIYFIAVCLVWNLNLHFAVKYLITFPLSVIGNYLLVAFTQMKKA